MATKMYDLFANQTFSSFPGSGQPPPLKRTPGTGSEDVFAGPFRGILWNLRFCFKSWQFLPICRPGRTSDIAPAVTALLRGMVPRLQSPAEDPAKGDEECPSTKATP